MANILIASLGDSPVVVTAMYDLLTGQEKLPLDKVIVLHPQGDLIPFGFDFIQDALLDRCEITAEQLPFEDANSEQECYTFLRQLSLLLANAQQNDDAVYLSLAGGRKNMSALMALLAPLFPCVKRLFHVIDTHEGTRKHNFLSFEELIDLSADDRHLYFFPEHKYLKLVDIPYGERQQVSSEFRSRLYALTEEDLDNLWDQDPAQAETIETYRQITQTQAGIPLLKILLTISARDEYLRMCRENAPQAARFGICFEQMKNPYNLKDRIHGFGFTRDTHSFHFYKRRRTIERPFYHTEPQDIYLFPRAKVGSVIISGLAVEHSDGTYKLTGNELLQAYDPAEQVIPLENVLAELPTSSTEVEPTHESILLVPLGSTPMVATQLYTLLVSQGRSVREVVLLYPAGMQEVQNSADMAKRAFDDEGVSYRTVAITRLRDIDSYAACKIYEEKLEETIDDIRNRYPDDQIDLALSGGRKGMAALAMFVAQRKGIHHLYHTLITDVELNQRVEDETTVSALDRIRISKAERNNRLFLRAYEGAGPYTKFVCFRVPVLPSDNNRALR